ncbi:type IV pilus biogenesis protein PilM [Brenneria izbisi]|uniref:Type IV pilus biogenesis protein PilM n=1 Tax=Brenneria izbisi TaxID=2939450 RepID=A0AA41Y4K9_9GAMM|nr:type IV pilus biogenesis protein PilM [Brenneria izbisi]MCV9879286.1 type IV pilus biogenesis protein PilM [Brenneria izbisi]MCV9883878.1 type IV pilus biogenesis protein PilM [Brenneria izbisi]
MGYAAIAFALVSFLIVGSVDLRRSETQSESITTNSASSVANDMLRIASAINDFRYDRVVNDGAVELTQLALIPLPDSRVSHVVSEGRLWVWTADFPGLVAALTRSSVASALICVVSQGRLKMLDGTDMNLMLPAGVADGDIVYLN